MKLVKKEGIVQCDGKVVRFIRKKAAFPLTFLEFRLERVIGFEPTTSCLAIVAEPLSTVSLSSGQYSSAMGEMRISVPGGNQSPLLLIDTKIDREWAQNWAQRWK